MKTVDDYNSGVTEFLDSRFQRYDESGVYHAHQPIYGFRTGHSESSAIQRYTITYRMLRALSRLRSRTLLDVGGPEGYTDWMCRSLSGVAARSCDLSKEACARASDIFGIEAGVADIHELPYADGEYDVVLCSETLEHVADKEKGLRELLRVAGKALVITVPHEREARVAGVRRSGRPHGHINAFRKDSFDFLRQEGFEVDASKMICPLLAFPRILVEAAPLQFPLEGHPRVPRLMVRAYNAGLPLLQNIFREKACGFIIRADELICRIMHLYRDILVTILIDGSCSVRDARRDVTVGEIVRARAPHSYLGR